MALGNRYWCGFLEAGRKSSHVLLDTHWRSAISVDRVLLFNLLKDEVVAYDRALVRGKLRSLEPDEMFLVETLVERYWRARRVFVKMCEELQRAERDDEDLSDAEIAEQEEWANEMLACLIIAEGLVSEKQRS